MLALICSILSRRIIKHGEVATADLLLLNFCKRFELLYGKDKCTPNLHLHLHIKDLTMGHRMHSGVTLLKAS